MTTTNFRIQIFDNLYVGFHKEAGALPQASMCQYIDNKGGEKMRDRLYADKTFLDPVVVDNKPRYGFRISRSAINNGYYYDNSAVKVEDPRGFEVMITVTNTVMLFANNLIQNGEIMTPCVWGRDGNVTVLLPINSEPYRQANENRERVQTTFNIRGLKPGNRVLLKSGNEAIYYGKVKATYTKYAKQEFAVKQSPAEHIFRVYDQEQKGVFDHTILGSTLMHKSGLGVSSVISHDVITQQEAEQVINDLRDAGMRYENRFSDLVTSRDVIFLSFGDAETTSFKTEEIDITKESIAEDYKRNVKFALVQRGYDSYFVQRANFNPRSSSSYNRLYLNDIGPIPDYCYGGFKIDTIGITDKMFNVKVTPGMQFPQTDCRISKIFLEVESSSGLKKMIEL